MSKRQADIELNHENWDDDLPATTENDESSWADETTLAKRKILVPKPRRSNVTPGLFKSLTGFSANPPTVPKFSFGSNQKETTSSDQQTPSNIPSGDLNQETEYLKELQTLNRNLLQWVEKHVKLDPHCILSPIFTDYEKHLTKLHEKYPDQNISDTKTPPEPTKLSVLTNGSHVSNFSAGEPGKVLSSFSFLPRTTVAGFGTPSVSSANDTAVSKPAFTFSLPPLTSNSCAPPLFKFGTSLPSSSPFGSESVTTANPPTTEEDDTEEYQPPKPEVREIKEEGSIYTIRCKLFYKVEAEWRERGVGNLFIKPQSGDKFQLLIRADTNLGNILLNVMINKDIPIKRQKNNLTLVCVPTPPLPTTKASKEGDAIKPALFLIRVKTEDSAIELLKQIDQHRAMGDN